MHLVEQWRRKLSEYEIQLLESRIGDMLAARGYELSGLPSIRISDRAEGRLRRQDRWARRRFGLNRYGLWLYLASVLSRRLRVRSWERRVRLRLNAIDVTHLK